MRRRRRHRPLLFVTPVWEHRFSDYPDAVRVPFNDGNVINYRREFNMPRPVLGDALDHFSETCCVRKKRRRRYYDGL